MRPLRPLHLAPLIAALLLVAVSPLAAQPTDPYTPPPGYYDAAAGKSGPALRAALHDIIDDHQRVSYDGVWLALEETDEDPSNPANVLTIYKRASVPKPDHSQGTGWNREHSWPKSYGFPTPTTDNHPYTDLHHLFPADWGYNSSRQDKLFDWCTAPACEDRPVDGPGGYVNRTATGVWEVWPGRRGEIARAMFYMDVRYEGGVHSDGSQEPDLILTDDRGLVVTTGGNVNVAYMGMLSALIEWNQEDLVDDRERSRNEVVFGRQQNRNPFADHPEWVCAIWPCGTDWIVYLPFTSKHGVLIAATSPPVPTSTPRPPTATMTPRPPTATITPPPTYTPVPAPAALRIGTLQCETRNEYVRVVNTGGTAANLAGWDVFSVVGSQTFDFPTYALAPGSSVYVHSGPDAPESGGNRFRWTGAYIWNNDGDTAQLKNPQGTVVDDQDC